MDIDGLRIEMIRRFEIVDERFERGDRRFEQIDARFEQIDRRFEQIDAHFEQIDRRFEQVDQRFERVDQRFVEITKELVDIRNEIVAGDAETRRVLSEQIAEEGRRTRHYFGIAVDQMKSERNLVLDQSAAATERLAELRAANGAEHATFRERLDDHEVRLRRIEKL